MEWFRDLIDELDAEVAVADINHPDGYPYTRDGVRLGIASLEDKIGKVWDEWDRNKQHLGNCHADMRGELIQAMGVAARMIRSIDESTESGDAPV